MTTHKEALKLALELFEQFCRDSRLKYEHQAIYKTITAIKEALAQQSNEQVEPTCWITPDDEGFRMRMTPPVNDVPLGWTPLFDHPPVPTAQPKLQTCNCRWDGEVQVQQCTLHESHVDAVHEWAERAKTAEAKLKAQPKEPDEVGTGCECPNCANGMGMCHTKEAQPKEREQEPVAYIKAAELEELKHCNGMSLWAENAAVHTDDSISKQLLPSGHVPVYTTPPQRKPLTDEAAMFAAQHVFLEWNRRQEDRLVKVAYEYGVFQKAIELYIEAAHGIKE